MPPTRPGHRPSRHLGALMTGMLLALAACTGATTDSPATRQVPTPTPEQPARLLVFTKTAGFRHASITDGLTALRELAAAHNYRLTATEDAGVFTDEQLAGYQALVFLHTTGHILTTGQQAAMERYLAGGGGFVGIHAAADGDPDWDWYTGLIGAPFASHPPIQPATLTVTDPTHPATAHLPATWQRTDEWYDFTTDPRDHQNVHVLLTVDETTYDGGRMGEGHPLAWCQAYHGGRSFYTALGHTPESYRDPAFRTHLLGGITWASGRTPADCTAR